MDVNVLMPNLGNEITEAQIDAWHRAVGERIERGEMLLTITTPKVTLEIEAPAAGVLKSILAPASAAGPGLGRPVGDRRGAYWPLATGYWRLIAWEVSLATTGAEASADFSLDSTKLATVATTAIDPSINAKVTKGPFTGLRLFAPAIL